MTAPSGSNPWSWNATVAVREAVECGSGSDQVELVSSLSLRSRPGRAAISAFPKPRRFDVYGPHATIFEANVREDGTREAFVLAPVGKGVAWVRLMDPDDLGVAKRIIGALLQDGAWRQALGAPSPLFPVRA